MELKQLVKYFANEYMFKTGNSYVPLWSRDGGIFKQILESIDADLIMKCVDKYFYSYPPPYTTPSFKYHINDIIADLTKPEPRKMSNLDSWRYEKS